MSTVFYLYNEQPQQIPNSGIDKPVFNNPGLVPVGHDITLTCIDFMPCWSVTDASEPCRGAPATYGSNDV
jgi:hypothetical protein